MIFCLSTGLVYLQSWTKVLTHLSKTNAFYPRPCVNSKHIFFAYSLTPSPPFQCWNTLHGHCHVVTTLKRGEGVEKWKFEIEKLTHLTKQVFFEECLLLSMIVAHWESMCKRAMAKRCDIVLLFILQCTLAKSATVHCDLVKSDELRINTPFYVIYSS